MEAQNQDIQKEEILDNNEIDDIEGETSKHLIIIKLTN